VEQALQTLGTGFLSHPDNEALRILVRKQAYGGQELYHDLLYFIYRLLFLLVAEERKLVGARESIYPSFGLARLRDMAGRAFRGQKRFQDYYLQLRSLFSILRDENAALAAGMTALGGDLFRERRLDSLSLDNESLLQVIRSLTFFQGDGGVLHRVNYAALNVEELGSVYESLLDFAPQIAHEDERFEFRLIAGTERKSTGSHYTPPELVAETLKQSLIPVMEERIKAAGKDKEKQIASLLAIRVLDPACGSGHFLLASARILGRRIAQIRTGNEEPGPEHLQPEIRRAISHCIYGVDKNPLAIDLCKVALWIEGLSEAKPLNFLDHRIRCGDSLVGVFDLSVLDPKSKDFGISDEAYNPVSGDDKTIARELKKANQKAREDLLYIAPKYEFAFDLRTILQLRREDDSLADIREKEKAFVALHEQNKAFQTEQMGANLWAAAYFSRISMDSKNHVPTTRTLIDYLESKALPEKMRHAVTRIATQQKFFHWPLEFSDAFAPDESGLASIGFDVVVGNPPWERIKLQEQEFFATRDIAISGARNKAEREKLIAGLKKRNPELLTEFETAKHGAECEAKFVRTCGRFPLTATGDVNTYALFAELFASLPRARGQSSVIVPTGIATDDSTKGFFAGLVAAGQLRSIAGFKNERFLFPAVEHRLTFCILSVGGGEHGQKIRTSWFAYTLTEAMDRRRWVDLDATDFALLNPNTRTTPVFRTREDFELTRKIYQKSSVLINEETGANPWDVSFATLFHMSNDSHLFHDKPAKNRLPLYEAKMFWLFDHRFSTYEGATEAELNVGILPRLDSQAKQDPDAVVQPRYWVDRKEVESILSARLYTRNWLVAFRDITNATNERTFIASILPRVGVGNNAPLLLSARPSLEVAALCANLSVVVFDFVVRQKAGGTHLNFFIVKQLPILLPDRFGAKELAFIVPRVLELVYTSWDIKAFPDDVWGEGIGNMEWGVGNGESGIGSPQPTPDSPPPFPLRHTLIAQWEHAHGISLHSFLSGLVGVAGGHEARGNELRGGKGAAAGRTLRNESADSEGSGVDSGEYRRRIWARVAAGVYPVSGDFTGFAEGIRDAFHTFRKAGSPDAGASRASARAGRKSGQDSAGADPRLKKGLTDPQGVGADIVGEFIEYLYTTPDAPLPIPPFIWNEERRAVLRAELDAYYGKLYGLTRDEMRYILDPKDVHGEDFPSETFRVLKDREIREYGEYRTRRLVLEAWERV
jgi:hypothetical protein